MNLRVKIRTLFNKMGLIIAINVELNKFKFLLIIHVVEICYNILNVFAEGQFNPIPRHRDNYIYNMPTNLPQLRYRWTD